MDAKRNSKKHLHTMFFFYLAVSFGFKARKKVQKKPTNFCFAKILYGYHKTQNWMPNMSPLKKMQKSSPKKIKLIFCRPT
jgi:hypothetical protein